MTLEDLAQPCVVEYTEGRHGAVSPVAFADDVDTMLEDKFNHALEFAVSSTQATSAYIAKQESPDKLTFVAATDQSILGQSLANKTDDEGNPLVAPFHLFKPVEEEEELGEPGEDAEDVAVNPVPQAEKAFYIKNVLRDPSVDFLKRVPQLGAFCAVKIPFQDCMHKDAVPEDGGLIVPPTEEETSEETSEEAADEETKEDGGQDGGDEEKREEDGENEEKNAEEEEDGQPPEKTEPERRWRANCKQGFYVLCADTMDNGEDLSEEDLRTVESVAASLSACLTPTLDRQYQSEMALRFLEAERTESAIPDFEATVEQIDTDVQAAVEEFGELEEEEKCAKEAALRLEQFQEKIISHEWWTELLRFTRKRCIPFDESIQEAIKYAYELAAKDTYISLKDVDLEQFVKAIRKMSQQEEELDQQTAQQHIDRISETLETSLDAIRKEAFWLNAVLLYIKHVMQRNIADRNLRELLEAKAAAAEAEKEAEEQPDAEEES